MSMRPDKALILVVDDKPENLMLLTEILTGAGYDLRQVRSGEQALKAATAEPPDLILLDIEMPGMDGYELCRHLKQDEYTAAVPVIFISGLNDVAHQAEGFVVGGVDFITKPYHAEIVLARVDTHIQLAQAQANLRQKQEELLCHFSNMELYNSQLETQAAEMVGFAENEALLIESLKYEVDVKNKFFSIIAHDLKSPFTCLLGMTQMMAVSADKFSKDQLVNYASKVNEAGEQFFELLRNLLEWSRLQMEGANSEPEEILLYEAAQEMVDLLKPIALEKDITLTNNIKKTPAFTDRNVFQTVIRNLTANSLKFTPSGGKVELSSVRRDEKTQITVTDTGVGMSQGQAEKVFSLDQDTSTPGTAGEKGTGLGLPLCKDMLERNGGRIWLESTPGEGTRFHFTVPIENSRK